MMGMRKWVGFLMALAFAVFALPGIAAPAKIFGLVMAPSTVTTATGPLTATFSNLTPNGNSVINTVILTPPTGVTATATFPNGGNKVTCPATTVNNLGQTVAVPPNSICVANIPSVMKAGCSPVACSWTMNVTATLPNTCSVNPWAGQAFAGNSFNGDVFEFQSGFSSVTTTINAGCTYNVNVTINPAGGGTVSCTSNPVSYGGSSTCTATAGSGFSFSGFSGDCTGLTCVLTNVTSTKNVTANFAHLPNAVSTTVLPAGSGMLTCTPNPVPWNTPTTCTAVAGPGYGFVNFSGDCSGTSCTLNNVTSAKSVTANFAQNAITAMASPAAGGLVTCTPNPVPYGGNSSCTASANLLYTFTGFSGDCTGATCAFINVTSNKNVTANFVSNTLLVTSAPSSVAVPPVLTLPLVTNPPSPFSVTVTSSPGTVTITPDTTACGGATWATPVVSGMSTTFTFTIPSGSSIGATCTISFSANNYGPTSTTPPLPVYKGVLDCNDYDSVNGAGDALYDPDLPSTLAGQGSSYVGAPGWGLRRGPNRDGSATCVKVNYTCNMDTSVDPAIATCTWDKNVLNFAKTGPEQATFKYLFLWPAKAPDASGWTSYRPWVSWPPAPQDNTRTWPNWAPLVSCVSDLFSNPPTWILPTIPTTDPQFAFATNPLNTLPQYQGGAVANVCGAQQGWTAIGTAGTAPGNGVPMIQIWNIIIDEADLKVSGP